MSVDRWIGLLPKNHYDALKKNAFSERGESWFYSAPAGTCFDFGDAKDYAWDEWDEEVRLLEGEPALPNIEALKSMWEKTSSMDSWDKIRQYIEETPDVNCYFYSE